MIQEFPIPKKDYYKVYVRTNTFNQDPYIEDCLNGVAMQETSFPFVHHVIDDASTDGEQDVIKAWMSKNCDMEYAEYYDSDICSITLVKNKKNPNYTLAAYFLKKNMFKEQGEKRKLYTLWRDVCKYSALCEGDDFWTDKLKLQKQYDSLESNPSYSLCHCGCLRLNNGHFEDRKFSIPQIQNLEGIVNNNCVATASMFYRNLPHALIPNNFPFKHPVYQHFLNLRLAEYGDIYYIDEPMCVYRISDAGIYSRKTLRQQYNMAMGNLENMLDWYTIGSPKANIVKLLKKRVITDSYAFAKQALKKGEMGTLCQILSSSVALLRK